MIKIPSPLRQHAFLIGFIAFWLMALCIEVMRLPERQLVEPDQLPDFASIEDVTEKKQAFFAYLALMAEAENRRILGARQRIETLRSVPTLKQEDTQWLTEVAGKLGVTVNEPMREDDFVSLLRHVDVVPNSLILAQAAIESAWGTSRFAIQGNNLFGQWCFEKGCGIVPEHRPAGATHEVRHFYSPRDAVAGYLQNINSHPAYRQLRQIREKARTQGRSIQGCALARGLEAYSERGKHYINEVLQMIRINDLTPNESNCQDIRIAKPDPVASDATISMAPDTTLPTAEDASKTESTNESDPTVPEDSTVPYSSTGSVPSAVPEAQESAP